MSTQTVARQLESYNLLKNLLHQFRATFDPHLDEAALSGYGVDVSKFDLEHDTNDHSYFLPMTPGRVKALDKRPELDLDFSPRKRCRIKDAIEVDFAIDRQLFGSKDEEDGFQAYLFSPWRRRRQVQALATLVFPCKH